MSKQRNVNTEEKEKLLQEESVHKELENKIIELIHRAEIRDWEIFYQFALRVIG